MLLIQFTGLSGAGKTSIAQHLKQMFSNRNVKVEVLDGDACRKTLSKDLGFSKQDRCANVRRLAEFSTHLENKDIVVIAAINPYEEIRKELSKKYKAKTIWINCNLNVLIQRDTKNLYMRAMLPDSHPQKLYNLSGINDVYENPPDADLIVHTDKETLQESAEKIYHYLCSLLEDGL